MSALFETDVSEFESELMQDCKNMFLKIDNMLLLI